MSAGLGVRRARLRADVDWAGRLVGPQWPLERWVAVNPLSGLVPLGFAGAVAEARRWLGVEGCPPPALLARAEREGRVTPDDVAAAAAELDVDLAVARTEGGARRPKPVVAPRTLAERHDHRHGTGLAAEVDELVAASLPELLADPSSDALVVRWARLLRHHRRARRLLGRHGLASVATWPDRADDLLLDAERRLGFGGAAWREELRGQVARTPGWAAYAQWCDGWAGPTDPQPRLSLLELLAMRVAFEVLVVPTAGNEGSVPGPVEPAVVERDELLCLHALERAVRRELLDALDTPRADAGAPAAAQVVCCIDVRSEGLRRHLEAVGPYETFGFAGFFAAPVLHREVGAAEAVSSAPVLVQPELEVADVAAPGGEREVETLARSRGDRSVGRSGVEEVLHHPLAAFPGAEVAGWVLGPMGLLRTALPGAGSRLRGRQGPPIVVDLDGDQGPTSDERAAVVEAALRTMGLTKGFAPLVVLCGHRATTTANAHAAALACGACGGNAGGANARAVVAMANDPAVRGRLAEGGLHSPERPWVLAAEHDTTTDEVHLLDLHLVPEDRGAAVVRLAADLDRAGARNAAERVLLLPDPPPRGGGGGAPPPRRRGGGGGPPPPPGGPPGGGPPRRRAGDWAQTQPEWGLARNAAMVVAPRAATRGLDLGGRVFLHSYDAEADLDGTALETILTAPVVVAHWINAQYLFSSVDPEVLGAGDKVLHNPVLGLGVLEGAGGDLRLGLPWQSVADGHRLHHEPVRLLVVVQSPLERVDEVLDRNPSVRELVDGSWIHLVAGPGPRAWRRRMAGRWVDPLLPVVPTGPRPEAQHVAEVVA